LTGRTDRPTGPTADAEPLFSEDKIHRVNLQLNHGSIVIATIQAAFTFALGLHQIAAVLAAAALIWAGIGVLMRRGYQSVALPLQHATGLAMITAVAVALGPEINVQLAFLLAAAMPPLIWTLRKRIEWWGHLGSAVILWAVVEAGILQRFATVVLSDRVAVAMRIELGLFIFVAFAFFIHGLILMNHRTEARFQRSNGLLAEKIRERERIEAQLKAARDAAERANRAKDDFLARMSREIRTPMNTIIGLAGLSRRSQMSAKIGEYIGRIRSSSEILLGIVNDILDLSRIEARKIELDDVSFDLRKVLDHLADLVGDSASTKGIKLLMTVDADVPRSLMGDGLRLGQVLTNLTSNAVKFTAEGLVSVRVQLVGEDEGNVDLRFAVEDTGIGIPEHLVPGLFESFVQADRSTTRRFGGSGLGLTISRSLVELMGGDILVKSEEGSGSVFSFELTLARAPRPTREDRKQAHELEGLGARAAHDYVEAPFEGDIAACEQPLDASSKDSAANAPGRDRGDAESPSPPPTWFSRLIGYGVSPELPPGLVKRLRLANTLVLALIATALVYTPVYLAADLFAIAAITASMGVLWLASYGLLLAGRHRSGRFLMTSVAIVGCFAYAFAFGPRANYQALLFNGMILPPIIYTLRERHLRWGFGAVSLVLWVIAESGALAHYSLVLASDTTFALLHANATLICFGFLAFAISSLAWENFQAEGRLQAANTGLRTEIDERAKVQIALMEAREKAEDARHAKSAFLANMSHEIRTPMNAILGLTGLSLRCELTASVRDQISRIQSSAQTLLGIVNDILDISRLEARRIELETLDFNLDQVLDRLTGSAGTAASSKGLEFLVMTDPDVPQVLRGDPLRLGQVLSNLADNAVDATDRGEIVVRVERRASDPLHADLRFSVSDTGVGFPFQSITEFSAAVRRTGKRAAGQHAGAGLGLILAGRLVELMGGELQVDSQRQIGSTFRFDIQLEHGEGEETISALPGKLLGAPVLVSSRNAIAADVICSMVSSCGFEPTAAASEGEAQQRLIGASQEGLPFRVVVIDRPAGSEEPMEVLPSPSEEIERPAVLLLVTARDRANLGSPSDVDGILVKPIRRSALFDTILASLGHVLIPPDDDMSRDLRSEVQRIHGARVLVVEDNEPNQIVARGILEDAGLRVDLANNGREAVKAVARSTYDLVFMDLHMPLMDGYEATRRIRRNPDHANLPIVAMTADAREETQEACAVAGMNDHVTKPLDRLVLLANLVAWIAPVTDREKDDRGYELTTRDSPGDDVVLPTEISGLNVEEALDRLSGHHKILADVLASFDRRYRGREVEIEEAWNRGDGEWALELAHQLKGSAGNISAHELCAASAEVETAIRSGDGAAVPDLVHEQRRALEQLLRSLDDVSEAIGATDGSGRRSGPMERVDPNALRPHLEELIGLLASRNLRARAVFDELRADLGETSMRNDFDAVAQDLGELDFAAAREKLLDLGDRHGVEIRETTTKGR
jgi:signal transduction histidine kinase/DNA-binding response OmpR family regulator